MHHGGDAVGLDLGGDVGLAAPGSRPGWCCTRRRCRPASDTRRCSSPPSASARRRPGPCSEPRPGSPAPDCGRSRRSRGRCRSAGSCSSAANSRMPPGCGNRPMSGASPELTFCLIVVVKSGRRRTARRCRCSARTAPARPRSSSARTAERTEDGDDLVAVRRAAIGERLTAATSTAACLIRVLQASGQHHDRQQARCCCHASKGLRSVSTARRHRHPHSWDRVLDRATCVTLPRSCVGEHAGTDQVPRRLTVPCALSFAGGERERAGSVAVRVRPRGSWASSPASWPGRARSPGRAPRRSAPSRRPGA